MTSTLPRATGFAARKPVRETVGFPAIASERSRLLKRSVDLVLGGVAFVTVLPLMLLIAVAILLESGGPVFFSHQRVGRRNSRFRLWKFRTMVVDGDDILDRYLAENEQAAAEWMATQKLRHDPRVTRVGRFLRRTSLDELPQLWNVLRGEMSLAGPRPIVEAEIRHYGPSFPFYSLAYPGLTGLWQVSGRSDTTYTTRVALDVAYVRGWNGWLDLRLFFQTFRVVAKGKGAY